MVTMVLLPAIRSLPLSDIFFAFFEWIERRFAFHARILTVRSPERPALTCCTRPVGGRAISSPASWWLHAMTLVWVLFTILLFVLEPLVLHRKLLRSELAGIPRERPRMDPASTLDPSDFQPRAIAGAVAGSHGWTFGG